MRGAAGLLHVPRAGFLDHPPRRFFLLPAYQLRIDALQLLVDPEEVLDLTEKMGRDLLQIPVLVVERVSGGDGQDLLVQAFLVPHDEDAEWTDLHQTAGEGRLLEGDLSQRLFQAARFVTEMQYQHLVFEEFARTHTSPGATMDVAALRDHASEILDAFVHADPRPPGFVGEVVVLKLEGHMTLDAEEKRLRDVVDDLIAGGRLKVVIDLGAVPYVDSLGIGEFVRVYAALVRAGGSLRIAGAGRRVREVLDATQLAGVLGVSDSIEEALTHLQQVDLR